MERWSIDRLIPYAKNARSANTSPLSRRGGLKKAEGQFWKLALTPPGQSNRTDKSRLLAVLGISEIEYIARYTSVIHIDWVMRCTPRKVLRVAEQEPVVLPPTKAKRAA